MSASPAFIAVMSLALSRLAWLRPPRFGSQFLAKLTSTGSSITLV